MPTTRPTSPWPAVTTARYTPSATESTAPTASMRTARPRSSRTAPINPATTGWTSSSRPPADGRDHDAAPIAPPPIPAAHPPCGRGGDARADRSCRLDGIRHHHLESDGRTEARRRFRHGHGGGRRQVPQRPRRNGYRHSLLQGHWQHRHTHGNAVVEDTHQARVGEL